MRLSYTAAFTASLALALMIDPAGHAQVVKRSANVSRTTAMGFTEVRAVASDPKAHLGRLVVTGYVGRSTPHKGFILVDNTEFRNEGLACLTVPEPTKIPVVWRGAEPKVKQAVKVIGTLAKTPAGYTFTASQVSDL